MKITKKKKRMSQQKEKKTAHVANESKRFQEM